MTRRHMARHPRAAGRREKGIAIVIALFTVATLLLAAASAFLVGAADVRATRNYRGASQVHMVAEGAISHVLQTVNQVGVVNFQNEVVNQWPALFGTGTRSFGAIAGYTYRVNVLPDATDPVNWGTFVATADGPEGAHNVVVARVQVSNVPNTSPGAVYLAQNGQTDATFNGNAFTIDGNDHNYTGGMGPAPAIPGISTRNAANTGETIGSLNGGQLDNVLGLGYLVGPPIVPSVQTSGWAPSVAQVNQIAADLLALPRPPDNPGGNINGNAVFGTTANPVITHFTSNTTIKANGNSSGAGIMIVEGDLTIQGNFDFKGLIIVRGQTNVTEVTGNATVYGSIWTNDVKLDVAGSAIVYYSSQALALANMVANNTPLPAPIMLSSLADCSSMPSGAGNCP